MSNPRIDVVISTFGSGSRISQTIESLRRSSITDFSILVLDQNDDLETYDAVMAHAAIDPRVRYQRVPLSSIAATRNRAIEFSDAPLIAFTNDDCIVEPTWLQALLDELRAPDVCAVFGRVLAGPREAHHSSQSSTDVILALKTSLQREIYVHNRFNLGFGHGHNMAIRREAFIALDGFDTSIGVGGSLGAWDERDLGYRLLRGGGIIVYTPRALVYHCHWQTWQGARRSYRRYGIGVGFAVAKHINAGDRLALLLLIDWILNEGLRQVLSGVLKWRSWGKISLGLSQLFYPLLGLLLGNQHIRAGRYAAQVSSAPELELVRSHTRQP